MTTWTFQNADRENHAIKIAEDYVANWGEMKRNHMGYLIWGPIGTGKSYLAGYELLIIDDLGAERSSEYALENVFSVIDRRYRSRRPLIVTTNLPLPRIKTETDIEKRRIYDRILEMCIPLKVDGESRWEAIVVNNVHTMKKILNI